MSPNPTVTPPACARSSSARSASSSATSARARSTRSRSASTSEHGVAPTPDNVLGVLSLIFWALTMVVTVKYLTFIMRADNDGEGGILALLALVPRKELAPRTRIAWTTALVVFGAALLYGDGVITPAISVLSRRRGARGRDHRAASPCVVPLTCVILVGLFLVQNHGTAGHRQASSGRSWCSGS